MAMSLLRGSCLPAWMKAKLFQFRPPETPAMLEILLELVKHYEAFYPNWYTCPGNVRTIGYGHTGSIAGLKPAPWPEPYAAQVLQGELELEYIPETIAAVQRHGIDWSLLSNHQQAALVSFSYNLGAGSLKNATFARRIAAGAESVAVCEAWHRWNRGGGKILPGLVRRRFSEAKLYTTGKLDLNPAGWKAYYETRR